MRTGLDYYNDNDPGAAAWLRELIRAGEIPEGDVDERSILDIRPADLAGYRRVHFFAGIGGWAEALRLADWPEDLPVWTGSPPCQPLSVAGKQLGRDDPRHLAPHFVDLVRACRPGLLFGEQVASADVFGKAAKPTRSNTGNPPQWAWIDDLCDRLEAARYAVGANDFPSAGVGAPHIRQRTFFGAVSMADTDGARGATWLPEPAQRQEGIAEVADDRGSGLSGPGSRRPGSSGLADSGRFGLRGGGSGSVDGTPGGVQGADRQRERLRSDIGPSGATSSGLADLHRDGCEQGREIRSVRGEHDAEHGGAAGGLGLDRRPGPTNGFWATADWLHCRDAKWRPVEPGTFPLAHGIQGRVGLLRGYGNAINPHAAAQFIRAFREALEGMRAAA